MKIANKMTRLFVLAAIVTMTSAVQAAENEAAPNALDAEKNTITSAAKPAKKKPAAAKKKKPVEMKFEYVGKLKSVEKYFAGWGAAKGQFPHYKLEFEVVKVTKGELKVGQIVLCDQSATPRYKSNIQAVDAKVGSIYRVTSPSKHPAHADGLYLLDCKFSGVEPAATSDNSEAKKKGKKEGKK